MIDRLAKSAYVGGTRVIRSGLRAMGVLDRLDRSDARRAKWARSLFAIYDLDDMEKVGLPWWTFDAIDAVERFLGPDADKRVFEWGSSASTLWLASRAASVTSVEFDADWHTALSEKLVDKPSVSLKLAEATSSGTHASQKSGFDGQFFDAFVTAIRKEDELFDVIVIDGRAREACLLEAIPHLAPGGIIVLDDTKRTRYRRAIDASGLASWRFVNLDPEN